MFGKINIKQSYQKKKKKKKKKAGLLFIYIFGLFQFLMFCTVYWYILTCNSLFQSLLVLWDIQKQ